MTPTYNAWRRSGEIGSAQRLGTLDAALAPAEARLRSIWRVHHERAGGHARAEPDDERPRATVASIKPRRRRRSGRQRSTERGVCCHIVSPAPVEREDVELAGSLVDVHPARAASCASGCSGRPRPGHAAGCSLRARDLLHLALCTRRGVDRAKFDRHVVHLQLLERRETYDRAFAAAFGGDPERDDRRPVEMR